MNSYKIIEIYKGVAEYSAWVAGLQFSNPIEKLPIALGISDLAIEKVEITSHVQNGKSETPPTGVGGFFCYKPSAWILRTAAPSPGRSLMFYAAK